MATVEIAQHSSSALPILAILIPAVAAGAIAAIGDRNEKRRNLVALLAAAATFAVVLASGIEVMGGTTLHSDLGIIQVGHEFSLTLVVDPLGAVFAMVAGILWVAAIAHSYVYMYHEHKRTRFFAMMMLIEAAILGMFMVHDFFSLFIFFEIMGLAAYLLVIHSETQMAHKAATKYIWMAIIGGLSSLMGILLYLSYSGTADFIPAAGSEFLTDPLKSLALACMIAGFGVKAGVVPLHVWLPDAHPVAPSPASALLSGVMIKAGAYGIIRVVTSFFYIPPPDIRSLGLALIGIAMTTAFVGMVLAVKQSDIKRTLAYSSISQMGFLLLGVGCLAYLGDEGTIGLAGSLYHVINHAFFKGCLFLVAGSVVYCTHERNMFALGGLWRRMPLTTVIWCTAALGLMGIPLFNGFVSKSMLHHSIVEANHLAGGGGLYHIAWMRAADILFVVISAGTILYCLKMSYYAFFRSPLNEARLRMHKAKEAPGWMLGGAGVLAAGVLVMGLAPGFTLRHLIIPVLEMFNGLDPHGVAYIGGLQVYSWYYIKDILLPLSLGAGAFTAVIAWNRSGTKDRNYDPFHFDLPSWLSVDRWYRQSAQSLLHICLAGERFFEQTRTSLIHTLKKEKEHIDRSARRTFTPMIEEYCNDLVLGTVLSLVFLVLLLVATLIHSWFV